MPNYPPRIEPALHQRILREGTSRVSHDYKDDIYGLWIRSPSTLKQKKQFSMVEQPVHLVYVLFTRIFSTVLTDVCVPRAAGFTSVVSDKMIPFVAVLKIPGHNSHYASVALSPCSVTLPPLSRTFQSVRHLRHLHQEQQVAKGTETRVTLGLDLLCCAGREVVVPRSPADTGAGPVGILFHVLLGFFFLRRSHTLSHLLCSVLRTNLQHPSMAQH